MDSDSSPQLTWPYLDVYTNGSGELIIDAELSQVMTPDLDLMVDGCRLLIRGKRRESATADGYLIREIRRGAFERIVDIPTEFDIGAARAAYLHGVLRVTVPRKTR